MLVVKSINIIITGLVCRYCAN